MSTITKPKPARPVAGLGKGAAYGITDREHFLLSRFSNRCDEFGLKSVSIGKGPFGVGCCLKMSGGKACQSTSVMPFSMA